MTHAITIELSDKLYDQLQRTAELTQRPLGQIVEQSLAHSISPLQEEVPLSYQRDVYPLLEMDEVALMHEVRAIFPTEQWDEYEGLLNNKKERPLSNSEQARLGELRRQADLLMLRKGYAALLLKRRGYHAPTVNELPRVS